MREGTDRLPCSSDSVIPPIRLFSTRTGVEGKLPLLVLQYSTRRPLSIDYMPCQGWNEGNGLIERID